MMPVLNRVVVRPVVTEKSSAAYTVRKEYAFEADPNASKHDIKAAIETLFNVTVVDVRTMMQRSKRRTMGRTAGRRPRWKKAYVRLKEGDAIQGVFEG
jgi:large subunit ribosomal protein L23